MCTAITASTPTALSGRRSTWPGPSGRRARAASARQPERPRQPRGLAAAQDAFQGAGDLGGKARATARRDWRLGRRVRRVRRMRRVRRVRLGCWGGHRVRGGVPDQPALQAFHLVQPPDQVRVSAPDAAREVRERGGLAGGADEHLMLADYSPAPRAALARLRVRLPRAAPVTRHLIPPVNRGSPPGYASAASAFW